MVLTTQILTRKSRKTYIGKIGFTRSSRIIKIFEYLYRTRSRIEGIRSLDDHEQSHLNLKRKCD